jgi:hypothetical protein
MDHTDKFWSCFMAPPAQPAVGQSPQIYLNKLNELCRLVLVWPDSHPTDQLTRTQLRKLCRDTEVDVLIAYAAVMAWGGRGVQSRNYRSSLTESSREPLIAILKKLCASTANRCDDFAAMQKSAKDIKGLGISFYTKLLFFFRKDADAYILDQFTAKSAKLLFDPCNVALNSSGYPAPNNLPASYEWFCAAIEQSAASRAPDQIWTGEQVEQAMFDIRGGEWRRYLRSIYGAITRDESLPSRVAITHAVAYQEGKELPGANPNPPVGNAQNPVRVHCRSIDGIIWQYAFNNAMIHAEVFIPAQHVGRYDVLRHALGVDGHDFGDGILGNGENNGITRSLKLTIPRGLNAPQNEWDEIANEAVSAMITLFERICENL